MRQKEQKSDDIVAFTDKDFRDLSPAERADLKVRLQSARYVTVDGVFVAENRSKYEAARDFCKELKACKVLCAWGHTVFLLPFDYARDACGNQKKAADTLTDGEFLELKETDRNIRGNYNKAIGQGKDVLLYVTGDVNRQFAINEMMREIGNIRKQQDAGKKTVDLAGNVYIYLEKRHEMLLLRIKTSGVIDEDDPRLGALPPAHLSYTARQ
ncbi:MAG: hypothetical protein K2I74_06955 [Treponemataceae bacterium]|nr:hypothetical protein [Treponemataceae bacterium]